MNNIVTSHSDCIEELIEVLGLQDKSIVEINFKVGVGEVMSLTTKEYVSESKFGEVVKVLRKYKVTEVPNTEGENK